MNGTPNEHINAYHTQTQLHGRRARLRAGGTGPARRRTAARARQLEVPNRTLLVGSQPGRKYKLATDRRRRVREPAAFRHKSQRWFDAGGEVQYRSVGVLAAFNWLQLDTKSVNSGPLDTSVNLKSDYIYSTAALTYSLPLEGKFHAEVLAGARIWNVSSDFTFNGVRDRSLDSSNSKTWVDPILGANLRYDLTRHWLLLVRGTVGGFANNDLGYDVFAGPGYQFASWGLVTVGYRYLHQEYSHSDFNFNATSMPTRMVSCWALYANSERGLKLPVSMNIDWNDIFAFENK
jgi:hypothetical protein